MSSLTANGGQASYHRVKLTENQKVDWLPEAVRTLAAEEYSGNWGKVDGQEANQTQVAVQAEVQLKHRHWLSVL